jgi:transcriptional regulator with XRE-family HTH domain
MFCVFEDEAAVCIWDCAEPVLGRLILVPRGWRGWLFFCLGHVWFLLFLKPVTNNGVICILDGFIPKRISNRSPPISLMFPTLEDIAKKRRQLGLKQAELAKLAGVSQSLIAKLESGKIDSSYTKVKTIFDVIDRLETKIKIQEQKIVPNKVISVQKDEPLANVVQLMKEGGYSQIPVFNKKQSVGSISEKTILRQNFGRQIFGSNFQVAS